jgi:hypothetical protein
MLLPTTAFRFSLDPPITDPNGIKGAKRTKNDRMEEGHHESYIFEASSEEERQLWICSIQAEIPVSNDSP